MADKLLEVKGVSKIFRVGGMLRGKKLVAVDNVSLSIDDDKPVILSIVGESGCGKSTLCKMILRLHNPDMGDIVLDGKSYAVQTGCTADLPESIRIFLSKKDRRYLPV